jgi:gliding motility-associated-like protein
MKLKISIAFLLIVVTCSTINGQHPSKDGRFQVDNIVGCAPFTVNVSIVTPNECSATVPCEFFHGTGGADPIQKVANSFSQIYTQPGTYTLRVLFQGVDSTDRISITVLPDTQPEFEVYSCEGNAVQVNITDTNTNYNSYVVDFNDGTVISPVSKLGIVNHTYLSGGTKTVSVRGRRAANDADNCTPGSQQIIPLNTFVPPTISQLEVLNANDIQLDFNFNNQPNILYRLQIARDNATGFQNLQNVYEIPTTTVSNLDTEGHYYCFRLAAFDPCDNSIGYYSNTICSSDFDVTAQNNQNRLSWRTSATGVSNYNFSKSNGSPLSAPSAAIVLNDPDVSCGINYCYQQTTNYANGSRSISLSKCVSAISTNTPTVVENISAIVGPENNTAELQWTQDPAFIADGYAISKFVNGTSFSRDSSTTTAYADAEYLNEVISCYRINYADACKNQSPVSIEACPIKLIGTLQPDNSVSLTWTPYEGWKNGVDHYIVEKYDDNGQLMSSVNTGTTLNYIDNTQDLLNQRAIYRIVAIPNQAGIASSISNSSMIIKEPNLFYPTAFTPNGDGLNDIFNVYGQYITTFEMRIFNRWGEMMYVTDDLEKGWNGFFKGNLMPEGTYVFRATISDQVGRTFDRSGTVLLLRKN